MLKLKRWLLRKFIREIMQQRQVNILMDIVWAEARRAYWEDNAPTRFEFLTEWLEDEKQREIRNAKPDTC